VSPASRIVGLVVPLVLLLATPDAVGAKTHPSKRRHIRSCAVPHGAQLVAQDSKVRIIAGNSLRPGNHDITREWRYCLRGTGRGFRTLVDAGNFAGGYGDIVDVGPVVLTGVYVAYSTETTASGGRYGNHPVGVLHVRNLVTGKSGSDSIDCGLDAATTTVAFCAVGPMDSFCSTHCGAPVLILTSDGVAAWEAEQNCDYSRPCAWAVQVLDSRTGWQAVLDRLPLRRGEYLPDPFANLHLYQCSAGCSATSQLIATWTNNDVPHTAGVQ
jgi:hypothetical protein